MIKHTKAIFLAAIGALLLISSCGDSESGCVQEDWVGVYSGTSTITENNVSEFDLPTELTIIANGNDFINISFEIERGGGITETSGVDGLDATNCSIDLTDGGLSAMLDLDGNNLTANVSLDIFGILQVIDFSGSK